VTRTRFLDDDERRCIDGSFVHPRRPSRMKQPRRSGSTRSFKPSTLSKEDQMKEMQWFIKGPPAPFKGMEINAVSENPDRATNMNRRRWRKRSRKSPASRSSTDIIQEGGRRREDSRPRCSPARTSMTAWINDSDFIGTHFRYGPSGRFDGMDGRRSQGRHRPDARRQRLHRQVVHHTAPNGHLYQLPDQQFREPLLVPLRLVSPIPTTKPSSRPKYGYDLGVPVKLVGL